MKYIIDINTASHNLHAYMRKLQAAIKGWTDTCGCIHQLVLTKHVAIYRLGNQSTVGFWLGDIFNNSFYCTVNLPRCLLYKHAYVMYIRIHVLHARHQAFHGRIIWNRISPSASRFLRVFSRLLQMCGNCSFAQASKSPFRSSLPRALYTTASLNNTFVSM